MGGLEIRAARRADVGAVLRLWHRAAEGTSITDDEDGLTRMLDRDGAAVLLAALDGEIVGSVIAGWDGWRCHLYRLAVAPEHRRHGIATALLAAAGARFVVLGGRRADAMVLDENVLAHRVWAANGYERGAGWSRWTKPLQEGA